jgi:hypothetical protein
LPEIPIPLLPGDPEVPLDLQAVLNAVFHDFGYASSIDYARPPEVSLIVGEATWVREQTAAWKSGRSS